MIDNSSFSPKGSTVSGRVPPQNMEAEQSVLGSILLKHRSLSTVLEILGPSDFYRKSHRLIFEAMIQLFEKDEPQDLITVANLLKDKNQLDDIGGAAYLATLTSIVPVTVNIGSYARIIRQKTILRKLIHFNTYISNRSFY
jgi:replicative DNA helicase